MVCQSAELRQLFPREFASCERSPKGARSYTVCQAHGRADAGLLPVAGVEAVVAAGGEALYQSISVTVPPGLADLVESLLARRVVDLVSMCRKANAAVMGYEKVKDWLQSGKARVLVQASDGSERGKTKLRPPEGEGRFIGLLTAGELGLAFGRERAIHAALGAGGLTTRVVEEAARLSGLRIAQPDEQDGGSTAMKDM
jgi:hypothetical protein